MKLQRSSITNLFAFTLLVRFSTEQIDLILGTPMSALITLTWIILGLFLLITRKVTLSKSEAMMGVAFAIFIFSGVISAFYNNSLFDMIVFEKLLKVSSYFLVFCLGSFAVRSRHDIRKILYILSIGVIISSMVALTQVILGLGYPGVGGVVRASGLASHPALLSILMIVCIYYFLSFGSLVWVHSSRKILTGLPITCALATILFSQTRTALAMLLIFIFLYILCSKRQRFVIAVALLSALMVLIIANNVDRLYEFNRFLVDGTYEYDDYYLSNSGSMYWRIHHWNALVSEGLQRPFLGLGPGMTMSSNVFELQAHSTPVEVFYEQGVLGIASFVFLVLTIALLIRRYISGSSGTVYCLTVSLWLSVLPAGTFGQGVFNETHVMQLFMLSLAFLRCSRKFRPG